MAESKLHLRIARQFIGDVQKGWCRLHPAVMDQLGISSGDAVLVSDGEHQVGYYAHSVTEEPRWDREVDEQSIYLDFHTVPDELPVETEGREVTVRPVAPSPARSVVYQDFPPGTASELVDNHTQENLLGTLAVVGARIWITYSKGESSTGGAGLEVYETDPDGVVVITESTTLEPVSER
ncbi:hypothetical protein ACFPYI_04295 [Halomarina salina]|uniref:Uncharacterized protein n=1 Tax=Halomarina salina TaxID=1872699 RepID=A0ABD5RJN7_9EURY|nr:hypothetical protein [Halomarina salina]